MTPGASPSLARPKIRSFSTVTDGNASKYFETFSCTSRTALLGVDCPDQVCPSLDTNTIRPSRYCAFCAARPMLTYATVPPPSCFPSTAPVDGWIATCLLVTFPPGTAQTETCVSSSRWTQKASVAYESWTHGAEWSAFACDHSVR